MCHRYRQALARYVLAICGGWRRFVDLKRHGEKGRGQEDRLEGIGQVKVNIGGTRLAYWKNDTSQLSTTAAAATTTTATATTTPTTNSTTTATIGFTRHRTVPPPRIPPSAYLACRLGTQPPT